jgi:outer membrane usher protein
VGRDASAQALISGGAFAGEGLLTHSFALQNGTTTRLLTTYQTDHFAQMKTLRVGDMVNTPGAWGRGVLFGGVQYGTNVALRPDFLTQSAPTLSGTALLPSTVDVYVNNALRSQQNVAAGPFTINNLPVVQGGGEVALVVKDVLGREQVITQQFLSTPTLLREGLVQTSLEAGALRQNLGLASNDYGEPFAATTYRKGLLPRTTAELRGELQPGGATAGASVATLLPQISSALEATLVASGGHGLADTGALASLGYSLLGKAMALNARISVQTDSFRQIGSDATNLQRSLLSLQWVSPWAGGTVSANYVQRRTQSDSSIAVLNLAYGKRLNNRVVANAALLRTLSDNDASVSATLGLTLFIDVNQFASTTVSAQAGHSTAYADYQQSAPWGQGTGYRLAVQEGGAPGLQQASVTEHQTWGSLQAEVAQQAATSSARITATGGIATLGHGLHFSRGLDQSFAVVQVGDLPNIPVFLENQEVARTGSNGAALVNNLRAYEVNRISIDPLTLPMEVSLKSMELPVVPRNQGGVQVEFATPRVRTVTLQLRDRSGAYLPAWTRVVLQDNAHPFVVGQRGEASVDLPFTNMDTRIDAIHHSVIAYPPNDASCHWVLTQRTVASAAGNMLPLQCE